MRIDENVLYEQFVDARRIALEITDQYREVSVNDPNRATLWERVVLQTETARVLLESWLESTEVAESEVAESAREPSLV
jgi:hypothetical protein